MLFWGLLTKTDWWEKGTPKAQSPCFAGGFWELRVSPTNCWYSFLCQWTGVQAQIQSAQANLSLVEV